MTITVTWDNLNMLFKTHFKRNLRRLKLILGPHTVNL